MKAIKFLILKATLKAIQLASNSDNEKTIAKYLSNRLTEKYVTEKNIKK